ncbi:MAG TPA: MFS transporter [Chloroflexota bacterium]|nr:MFS transporter [Chloroflexota bacterium]
MSQTERQPRDAVLLACACAVQIATYGCFFNLTPLYPAVGRDLGLDPGTLGVLVGVGGIVALLSQLPAGSGGDTYGRRPFFAAGMVCLLVCLLLRWQATQPAVLLIAQLAAGAALGMCSLNAFALAADVQVARKQGRSIGIVNASVSVGQVFGYLLAGTLGAALGWHELSLLMMVVPLAILLLVLRVPDLRSKPRRTAGRAGPIGILRALSHPRRLAFSAIGALTLGAGSGAAYLLPFALQTHDFGPLLAAAVLVPYVVGSVIAAPFSGDLAARFGSTRLLVIVLILGTLTCFALVWAGTSVLVLALANVVLGLSVNTTLPVASMLVVNMRVGRDPIGPGTALAGLRVGMSLGPFLGPTIAGVALARGGPEWAWGALGLCLLGSLGLFAAASRPTSRGTDA